MASISLKLPEEIEKKLSSLGNRLDEVAAKILTAGGEVVLKEAKDNLAAVIGSGTKYPSRATGELQRALGLSPVRVGPKGTHNVKVGFDEPHSGGVSNAMLANLIEYGKHGQPAKPFMKPAKRSSKDAAIEAMKEAFRQEVGE